MEELKLVAEEWIKSYSGQLSIFPDQNPDKLLHLNHSTFIGVKYHYFYNQIMDIQNQLGFSVFHPILKDLVVIRIFHPASKLRSLELLQFYFDIRHNRKTYYKIAPNCIELKHLVQSKVIQFAKDKYAFNFDVIFYDVTTLYFETFEEDQLRKNGFSKDNKSQQPQILIALMVTKEGFTITYQIFSGNNFEGHTILPVFVQFIKQNKVNQLTIVADAAMISMKNIKHIADHKLNYIVAARLGNISYELLNNIDKQLDRQDGKSIRVTTEYGDLICSFSSIRYRKELYEMNKLFPNI